ncbi:hypothetical protein QFW77_10265 [Luteimonas sp. RD2P54]|uniref:Uncharacterized protein n=1 Tax=Luteimonas endophytica TaxID=3042023 RepID=A0ABT6J979_9GAMM|nr:hypothetical protein [Luteimonas endophytica]MDH5823368.1 hypothetical protein [Luteimonas endophytica]
MRGLRAAFAVLLGLVVAVVALWGWSRWRGATPAQRDALAVMQREEPQPGRNAFAALWLLGWDVPEEAQEALAREDARRFAAQVDALPPMDPKRPAAAAAFRSLAEDRHERLPAERGDGRVACGLRGDDCLAKVRSRPDVYRSLVERQARLLERAVAIPAYGHYRNAFPPAVDAPFPDLAGLDLPLTANALAYVEGEVDGALARSCAAATGWRRLMGRSDSLVVAMVASTAANGHARLLADMLGELPPSHPLPAGCAALRADAQAPPAGLCEAMRGEWRLVERNVRQLFAPEDRRPQFDPFFDPGATAALTAQNAAWFCTAEANAALRRDLPQGPPERGGRWWRPECIANASGCILADIGGPAYLDYQHRMLDTEARWRLLRALQWMRERAAEDPATSARSLLAAMPGELAGSRARALAPTADGAGLRIALFQAGQDEWKVKLPPPLAAAPRTGRP